MSKLVSYRNNQVQTAKIICEINVLVRQLAYDGRANIKIRLRKLDNSGDYLLEALTTRNALHKTLTLDYDPFNIWFVFTKRQIKKGILISHCKKSRFGGYTFYD